MLFFHVSIYWICLSNRGNDKELFFDEVLIEKVFLLNRCHWDYLKVDSSMDNIELYSVFQCFLKGINDGHLHSVEEDEIVDVAQSLIDEEDLMELRRKKTLLERVMARLRELITASQQTGDIYILQILL